MKIVARALEKLEAGDAVALVYDSKFGTFVRKASPSEVIEKLTVGNYSDKKCKSLGLLKKVEFKIRLKLGLCACKLGSFCTSASSWFIRLSDVFINPVKRGISE